MVISQLASKLKPGPAAPLIFPFFSSLLFTSLGAPPVVLGGLTGFVHNGACSIHPSGALDHTPIIALCLLSDRVRPCPYS